MVIAEHGNVERSAMARHPRGRVLRRNAATTTTRLMALSMTFLPVPGDAGPERQNTVSRETSEHRRQLLERMSSGKACRLSQSARSFLPTSDPRGQSRPVFTREHPSSRSPIAIIGNCDQHTSELVRFHPPQGRRTPRAAVHWIVDSQRGSANLAPHVGLRQCRVRTQAEQPADRSSGACFT